MWNPATLEKLFSQVNPQPDDRQEFIKYAV